MTSVKVPESRTNGNDSRILRTHQALLLVLSTTFTGENNIVRLIEVTAVSKCILSTDRERPKSRPEQRSILSRGHLALFSSESRPPGFSIYQANHKPEMSTKTKSSISLLYLFEATLRAIRTIACEVKLAIQLVKNDGKSKCCTCCLIVSY